MPGFLHMYLPNVPANVRQLVFRTFRSRLIKLLVLCGVVMVICMPIYKEELIRLPHGQISPTLAGNGGNGVVIAGVIQNVDTTALIVDVTWMLLGCGTFCIDCPDSKTCGTLSQSVAVYTHDAAQTIASQNTSAQYGVLNLSSLNATATVGGLTQSAGWSTENTGSRTVDVVGFQTSETVDATRIIWNRLTKGRNFPLDDYVIVVEFALVASSRNTSVPVTGIMPYATTASGQSWDLDRINVHLPTGDALASGQGPPATISLRAKRSYSVKTFVAAVFIINWVITLALLMLTIWAVFLRVPRLRREQGSEPGPQDWSSVGLEVLCVLPLTALFSMPALRQSIDFPISAATDGLGFLTCIVIVAVCTGLMLGMLAVNLTWLSMTSAWNLARGRDTVEDYSSVAGGDSEPKLPSVREEIV